MRIIVNGNLFRGGVGIRFRNRELRTACANTCKEQEKHLRKRHRGKGNNRHRQDGNTREGGEEENYHRRAFPSTAKITDERVRKPCPQTAKYADKRRESGGGNKAGFDDEKRTDKGDTDEQPIFPTRFFTQDYRGKNYGEEGGEFIKDRRVRHGQMVDSVEITDNPHRACDRAR